MATKAHIEVTGRKRNSVRVTKGFENLFRFVENHEEETLNGWKHISELFFESGRIEERKIENIFIEESFFDALNDYSEKRVEEIYETEDNITAGNLRIEVFENLEFFISLFGSRDKFKAYFQIMIDGFIDKSNLYYDFDGLVQELELLHDYFVEKGQGDFAFDINKAIRTIVEAFLTE